ncbi:acyl-CoA N-acyltransferase [Schizophyllum commune]
MSFSVRPAVTEDIPAITSIYNHYINHSVATFRTKRVEPSVLLDTYCSAQNSQHPFLVAVSHNGTEILGYAYVSGYRASHPAYWHTVELSIYVHPDHLSGGVGSRLWTALEDALRQRNRALVGDKGDSHSRDERTSPGATPIRHVLSVMALDTEGSQGGYGLRDWYVKRGFVQKGHLEEVGYKFGRWIDTIILQLTL